MNQRAQVDATLRDRMVYMQVPDSDERDTAETFRRALLASDAPQVADVCYRLPDFDPNARTADTTIGAYCQYNSYRPLCVGSSAPTRMAQILMIKVVASRYRGNFEYELVFSDHVSGVFDGRILLRRTGPLLDALRDEKYFARAFLDAGALCWPNGLELSPARLYEFSVAGAN